MKKIYIIAGPNGAGKTTASFKILPKILECREFVNADEIARGLSPMHPEEMAIQAGRLQLERIQELLYQGSSFSVETTLATRSYHKLITQAKALGYAVELLFFYLPSVADAIERVQLRVESGGHGIPIDVIERRYHGGLRNLFQLYMPIVDSWQIINNKCNPSVVIAKKNGKIVIQDNSLFNDLMESYGRSGEI